MSSRDLRVQNAASTVTRRINRRYFLNRAAGTVAGAFATAVLGPLAGKQQAFASTYPCYPPCGYYCGGCSSTANCPTSPIYTITCTSSDPIGGKLHGYG